MSTNYDIEEEENEQSIDFIALFFKYLSYWKWFVVSLAICMVLSMLYLKMTTPVYQVTSTVLLKDDKKGGGMAELNALKEMGMFDVKNNVDNELEVLKTSNLAEQVVRELGLYVHYTQIGTFKDEVLYGAECPVLVSLADITLDTLTKIQEFNVLIHPNGGYEISGIYQEKDFKINTSGTDSLVALPFGKVQLKRGSFYPTRDMTVDISIQNPTRVAEEFLSSLTMELTSKTTSVVNITMSTNNVKLGKDFINKLIEVYNREDMKDQNLVASNTAIFIEDRLFSLTRELNEVESEVENYKQGQGLTDIKSEADMFIQQTGEYEQKRLEVETQLAIVTDIEEYIQKKENRIQLIPASTGIQSESLNSLINNYNKLLLERTRLSRTASGTNQAMIDLTYQIETMFSTVQSGIRNEKRSWQIARQDLLGKDKQNAARIKDIPRQEREYTEIKRQQSIKETLFLFLLQKKEENYLNMSVVVPKGKMIDKARSNGFPVSPKRSMIIFISFIIGLALPIAGITIRDLLRYQVQNKEELEKITIVPVLGEIPKTKLSSHVIIKENNTDSFTEMVRLLRTNLLFILDEPGKKVINVVSSMGGEGKTFVTINLAMSLALLDKKVLIIGLDIRKPKLGEYLGLGNEIGITLFLSGHMTSDELVQPSGLHPNLSVITAGPVPPNPNELLAKPALDKLMTKLRDEYDFIVLDTSPLGLVSDSFSLNRFADVSLYVVRADFTPKRNIEEATKLYNHQKLNNMYFVLNASDNHKSTYRYGYGYGYGKKQGMTYGYGNENS